LKSAHARDYIYFFIGKSAYLVVRIVKYFVYNPVEKVWVYGQMVTDQIDCLNFFKSRGQAIACLEIPNDLITSVEFEVCDFEYRKGGIHVRSLT